MSSHDPDDLAQPFADVFWPLFVRAFRLANAILANKGEAEDAAAEAMAKAHLHWGRIGALAHRDAWVLRVAGNEARSIVRRRREMAAPDPPPGFEDNVLARVVLAAAVSNLPPRQRDAVTLRYLAGLTDDEIAVALRIGQASVRTHVRRGLQSLRAKLDLEVDGALDG